MEEKLKLFVKLTMLLASHSGETFCLPEATERGGYTLHSSVGSRGARVKARLLYSSRIRTYENFRFLGCDAVWPL
jgi:hypothetical protein